MALVRKQIAFGAVPWMFTPAVAPAAGNLLVISAHTRGFENGLAAITGRIRRARLSEDRAEGQAARW